MLGVIAFVIARGMLGMNGLVGAAIGLGIALITVLVKGSDKKDGEK